MAKAKETADASVEGEAKVEAQAAPEAPQAPGLDLNDLAMILNLLNQSVKRGVWETNELRTVLDSYEKLEAFLQFQAQLQAAAKAQQGDA